MKAAIWTILSFILVSVWVVADTGINNLYTPDPLTIKENTTPANPTASHQKFYFKSDGKIYSLNSSGTERDWSEVDTSASMLMTEISTPANPPATRYRLYFKSDGFLYRLNSAGTESLVSPGNLTATEISQLENIDSTTISTTQWGYLGAMDQGIDVNLLVTTIRFICRQITQDNLRRMTIGIGIFTVQGGGDVPHIVALISIAGKCNFLTT